jgi:hypothetical protein
VYVVFSGPIQVAAQHQAALLYAGDGAALSHESAGWLWRLCAAPPEIHVSVPYRRQVDRQPGLVTHRSRTLSEMDIHPVLRPRRTRIERTIIDLVPTRPTAEAALDLTAKGIRQRATTPSRMREALSAHSRTRWRAAVLEALPDIEAGAHSALELRDAKLRRRHGLPMGTRQAKRLQDGTEYLDILIEEFGLHIELDGRLGHDGARELWRDMRRDNRSEVLGLRELRYGWADMFDRPCEVMREQAEILRQQGWSGRFRHCRACASRL